ncbi:hypothetical protein DENSPDRAFT_751327, partial [Dentipellis sp. KUC8613]
MFTETAAEAWTKLSERYEGRGEQKIAYLTGELFRTTFSDDTAMEPQLNGLRRIARTLTSIGNPISDKLLAVAMILSLPPSYDVLK